MLIVTAAIQDVIRSGGFHLSTVSWIRDDGDISWLVEAVSAETGERWAVTAANEAAATTELATMLGFDLEE